ncbi:MAG: hypothetical protein SR2Q5_06555 [Quinella sp. 2Q5]|nr:hypothetical protein [Quinella sp. 2Q5]
MEKPKSFSPECLYECIQILLQNFNKCIDEKVIDYTNEKTIDCINEKKAYDCIVDNIINNKATYLKDLYECDKITLHEVVRQAINYINSRQYKRLIKNH